MKIFLTGASGFIGSHLARFLIANGHQVTTTLRPGSNPWRIADLLSSLNIVSCDLMAEKLDKSLYFETPDIWIHLAWYVEPGKTFDSPHNLRSLEMSLRLARRIQELGCKRWIGAGTCLEYEIDREPLLESTPLRPRNLYAACKLSVCQALDQLCNHSGSDLTWLRFFPIYGPYDNEGRLLYRIMHSLLNRERVPLSEGNQVTDFLFIDDAIAAIATVIDSRMTGCVNVASANPVVFRDVATKIGMLLDCAGLLDFGALPYSPDYPAYLCAGMGRLMRETSWKPLHDLEAGLQKTIDWCRTR